MYSILRSIESLLYIYYECNKFLITKTQNIIYNVLFIGFGATLTFTGLHKSSKAGIDSTFPFLLTESASGTAKAMLISTLQASVHT